MKTLDRERQLGLPPAHGRWAPRIGRRLRAAALFVATLAMLAFAVPAAEAASSSWSDTGALNDARLFGHSTTVLKNGKVLVAGGGGTAGTPLASAEIYDPKTGTWSSTGSLKVARMDHTATLLDDGRVVVTGGSDGRNFPNALTSIEVYDPGKGTWAAAGGMIYGRASGTATLLPPAAPGEPRTRVLLIGGDDYFNPQPEIYDPAAGTTVMSGPLVNDRRGHTTTVLEGSGCAPNCGRMLVVGGEPDTFASAGRHTPELSVDSMGASWATTGSEVIRRFTGHSATALKDGKVLIAGGNKNAYFFTGVLKESELYDPVSGTFSATGDLAGPRNVHASVRLPSGKVLVAGGRDLAGSPLSSVETYAAGAWSTVEPMLRARAKPTSFAGYTDIDVSPNGPSATLLTGSTAVCGENCGKVLVVGGSDDKPAELYTPRPEVGKLAPAEGPANGGTAVTLEGTGLASVTSVKFGEVEATSVTPDAATPDTKLVAISPAQPEGTKVPVTATSGGGVSEPPTTQFTYTAASAGTGAGGDPAPVVTTPGVGGVQTTTPVAPQGGGDAAAAAALAAERVRARAFRGCLSSAARHIRRENLLARSGSARSRTLARRHARRHARALRARCVRLHGRTPGRVTGLRASAAVRKELVLSFRAPGTDRDRPPPARGYLVKQSTSPITDLRSFRRAQTLCNGNCRFPVTRVGEQLELRITDLRPRTTYYYAVAARDNVSRRLGPRSATLRIRTR